MEQLARQFDDLKVIKQKEAMLERRQKEMEELFKERDELQKSPEQKMQDAINADPFLNRS